MPQHFECFVYNNIYATMLFYGGVIRFSTEIMIFSLVTMALDSSYFTAWQAISFSKSHAFRDMVGIITHTGTLYDMYSLIADTPYDDTSANIGGLNDYTLMYSSGTLSQSNVTFYYYNQFYRFYSTGSAGDEDIILKINNKYCIASYF